MVLYSLLAWLRIYAQITEYGQDIAKIFKIFLFLSKDEFPSVLTHHRDEELIPSVLMPYRGGELIPSVLMRYRGGGLTPIIKNPCSDGFSIPNFQLLLMGVLHVFCVLCFVFCILINSF